MGVTLVAALGMIWALRDSVAYAMSPTSPEELGNLTHVQPGPALANRFVQGDALLASGGAIRYGRPLDEDTYRLAPVAGNSRIWVEVRVPKGQEGDHFIPPTQFMGRLVPFDESGLRHRDLPDTVQHATANTVPEQAWVLVDGEAPRGARWALGMAGLFLGFAFFNAWGLYRLLRPARE